MTEPYIGPLAPEWQIGHCAYSPTPADLTCLRDAKWHGIDDGDVARGLECCDEHKPIMATLVDYIHPLEPACGLPDAVFVKDENRCVVPWSEAERPAMALAALRDGGE